MFAGEKSPPVYHLERQKDTLSNGPCSLVANCGWSRYLRVKISTSTSGQKHHAKTRILIRDGTRYPVASFHNDRIYLTKKQNYFSPGIIKKELFLTWNSHKLNWGTWGQTDQVSLQVLLQQHFFLCVCLMVFCGSQSACFWKLDSVDLILLSFKRLL